MPNVQTGSRTLPYWELVTLIACIMALNAAAIDVFIPALSNISQSLQLSDPNRAPFVITAYVLGFGAAQIVYGTLSDRFGRRPVLLIGLAIYVAASLAAVFSPTFGVLLFWRAVQGIGAAATRVIAVSIVRDCFGGARMASVMSLIMMIFMVIPVIAPNLGQLILLFGNWREIFYAIAAFGTLVTLWTYFRLPETQHPEDRLPLTVSRVAGAFRTVVTNRVAFSYSFGTMLMLGVLFAFINQAEQVYAHTYALGPAFTLYFSAGAIFMAFASFSNSRLVQRFGMRRLSHGALVLYAALSSLHLVIALASGGVPPFAIFMPMTILTLCMFGFVGTNFNALAMDPLGHVAGTASSVLGFMQTLGGGLIGATIGYFYDGTLIPLLTGYVVLSLLSIGCVLIAERGQLFRRELAPAKAGAPAVPVAAAASPAE
ncbi:multidrug effflux MFS transporter [Aureimonas jatrophae]|uniref:Bcr/CflA family efflux transporter n=1 Tax=Aureimonas jatrophae TaxID=1166073 RepID=A0A1H0JJ28_9HYPH|nr:multidrug effflux MFS transporter [Aureimonas jatrophae]MBB3951389.1 DHA1 family bicyclomycin/chloramphenicol resistance-like MFS transporter [Aureimonas jatrophae]SDO43520.1 MFS transporter, DHA1 family, bicyclomycin/chloramphenicol resistance protein [Aureimonas jatrophae]